MENVVFGGLLIGIALLIAFFGLLERKRLLKYYNKKLQKEYGRPPESETGPLRKECIPTYHMRHKAEDAIDDITWNDLGMDQIFEMMNHTYSSSGEEYLYHILRTPVYREEELLVREQDIRYFMEHEKERRDLQMVWIRMGKNERYSLYDYIDFLREIYQEKMKGIAPWLPSCLVIISVLLLFVRTGVGLTALFAVIAFNIFRYYNLKSHLTPYLMGLRNLVRLIRAGKEASRIQIEVCKEQMSEIGRITGIFQPFLKKAGFVFASEAGSGNPLEILRDYINMIFHFDLIQASSMISMVEKNEAEIDRLNTAMGYVEAMIAIGSFRKMIEQNNGYCIPEFKYSHETGKDRGHSCGQNGRQGPRLGNSRDMGQDIRQDVSEIYHPLLESPIKNSYRLTGSMLITGSNASGKSTFLKTMAINQLFSQTIHMACAERFCTSFYRLYSSMALKDDLCGGDSYYMVEIKAMKRIVEQSRRKDIPILCFIDEVLRGTNTVERIAASTEILRFLDEQGVICVAATHDIELTKLLEKWYENYHFTEQVDGQDITFSYELLKGRADSRNAIRLLQVMGYDREIVDHAEAMARHFLTTGQWEDRGEGQS